MMERKSLYSEGYRAEPFWISPQDPQFPGEQVAGIRVKKPDGAVYEINCLTGKCSCLGNTHTGHCKHVRGAVRLLIEMSLYYATQRESLPPITLTAMERQMIHCGASWKILGAREPAYVLMAELEEAEWSCISLAANLRGSDWALPAKFTCPEEQKEDG